MTDLIATRRRVLALAGGLAVLPLLASPHFGGLAAADAVPANLTPEDRSDIGRIEDYLNGITTMQAKFQQYSAKGGIAFGTIYLKRPGFIRIEYDPPSPMLIVSDSVSLHYYDPELDQINRVPVSSSPIWFLLKDEVRFGGDVTVTAFQRAPNSFAITIRQTDDAEEGAVMLELGDRPLELRQWTVTDAKSQEVRVGLFNAQFGMDLDQQLFRVPRKRNN
ncbi:outer membrane lipoprotein-sorting protein [Dongia mobilis]|uniref:Outer membrane lipoprotein-sorting protein n=1 Tax=Dongia mobilis TaxID=578943 RepID=A0A4R6X1D1_9PROT|nr:outer membrane lipoprotein carrier protein LolA [Dongia mobilis]TDQ84268.1 outer membrane lipoprotein-sorting protein [Dongia mobilis]